MGQPWAKVMIETGWVITRHLKARRAIHHVVSLEDPARAGHSERQHIRKLGWE
jgi:hypothetical protein